MTDIRSAGPADLRTVLGMLDEAVAWLVARDRASQWGDQPWSTTPRLVRRASTLLSGGGAWLAEAFGDPAGALVLSQDAPPYVPAVDEPETYVRLLVTAGRQTGVGILLLAHAREQARAAGSAVLRVDCFAGGDGRLIRYYTDAGFTPTDRYDLAGWPGQVLTERL